MAWRVNLFDTSTQPTEAMREAMFRAEVGDDVYGEDPTVNRLEEESARTVGKEAAIFVPSGTMGNLIAMMVQTQPGDEVILESECHIYYYEVGGLSAIAGLMPKLVKGNRGVMEPDQVTLALRKKNIHYPQTSLMCIENTHNRAGGTITNPEVMAALNSLAVERGLKVHLDGARIFNAAVALGVPVTEITVYADTVMFCLSKGLSAPVGSIVAGRQETIVQARRVRKMLGGGMRQAGFLAAAGLVALHEGIERLIEDHRIARYLAEQLATIDGIRIDLEQVQTNMVMVDLSSCGMLADDMAKGLRIRGIKVSTRPPHKIRMVTHREVNANQVADVLDAVGEIMHSWRADCKRAGKE